MLASRFNSVGRRSRSRRRCVIKQGVAKPPVAEPERLLAFRNGLWAAELLKRHFPAFYQDHVAQQQVTLQFLAGVTTSFLIQANQHIFAVDEGWCDISLYGDPLSALSSSEGDHDSNVIGFLCDEVSNLLLHPFPVFWGLPRDWEALFNNFGYANHNMLVLTTWHLVGDTNWRNHEGDVDDDPNVSDGFNERVLDEVMNLPRLPASTKMDRLCDYLDTQEIQLTPEISPITHLGSILRYCLHMTGNGFADYDADIIMEDFGGQIDFDWWSSDDDLAVNRAAQQAAEVIYRRFSALDDVLRENLLMIRPLATAVLAAAAHLEANPEPTTLVEILGQSCDEPTTTEAPVPPQHSAVARVRRPWLDRQPQPRTHPQEDILMSGARPEAQISIFGDGTTLLTRRDGFGYRCYPIEARTLSQTLAHAPMSIGPLVPNTLGAGWMQGKPWFAIYVPPHTRTLLALVREVEHSFTFQLPPLIWWGWSNQLKIWALDHVPDPGTFPSTDTQLCTAPFPNCTGMGSICWGTATPPTIRSSADLLPALKLFLSGTYFNDHQANRKSKAYPVNVLFQWATIESGGDYPLDDLVPAAFGPTDRPSFIHLDQILNARWRFS